jgi:hypothetical protein
MHRGRNCRSIRPGTRIVRTSSRDTVRRVDQRIASDVTIASSGEAAGGGLLERRDVGGRLIRYWRLPDS